MKNLSACSADLLPFHTCKYCRQRFYYDTSRYLIHLRRHEKWIHVYPYKNGFFPHAVIKWMTYEKVKNVRDSTEEAVPVIKPGQSNTDQNAKPVNYPCQFCPRIYVTADLKDTHEKSHYDKQCRYCGKRFRCRRSRIIHERIHTKERPHQCKYCDTSFSMEITMTKHERIHTNEKPYQCMYCGKCFRENASRRCHERIHTKEKPFQCKYCKRSFTRRSGKTVHERIHTKEKPYQCKYCGKSFTTGGAKINHERMMHMKAEPFRCRCCGKCFKYRTSRYKHEKCHNKEKPSEDSVKIRHVRTYTEEEKHFLCTYCGKKFLYESKMTEHERIHTKEKPHQCKYCIKSFSTRWVARTNTKGITQNHTNADIVARVSHMLVVEITMKRRFTSRVPQQQVIRKRKT
ncbi:uncharacterized protein [Amphiura filiformis]|uniref:uncharacterized protein n=1 Tax=Amphiura filiformis TaxID=82378 RepID=UPI003B22100C